MNNFWEALNWEQNDPHLSDLKKLPFQRPFPELKLRPGLFIIRGPRQVGKTSWLKTELVRTLKKTSPKNIYFTSCELINDHKDLSEVLEQCHSRSLIFLDEVTFVKNWDRAIKHWMDTKKGTTIVMTGSSAVDLRRGADRMPGRHRAGGEFTLLPMNFEEFLKAKLDAGWITTEKIDREKELTNYFRIGGFPAAVLESGSESHEPLKAQDTYARWLIGDVTKAGKNETYLKEMVSQIYLTSQAPISLQKLAQRTQMGSHHTALDYLNILEDSFAATQIYAIDPNTGAKRLRKDKKIYFRDPLLYAIAKKWSGEDMSDSKWNEMMAEAVACEYLFRNYNRFGYFHSPQGEIDFYSRKKWALEIKWSDSTKNLSKAYKNMILPWKEVWTRESFLQNLPKE